MAIRALGVDPGPAPRLLSPPQDEMEIGYTQAPHQTLPVVFDSPRDRGLKDFPIQRVMVPAWGGQGAQLPKPLAMRPLPPASFPPGPSPPGEPSCPRRGPLRQVGPVILSLP